MCRWAAYIGSPIYLEDVICLPGHSLVRQSHGATRCHTGAGIVDVVAAGEVDCNKHVVVVENADANPS